MTILDSDQLKHEKLSFSERVQLEISKFLNTIGLKRLSNALWNDIYNNRLTPAKAVEITCRKFRIHLLKARKDDAGLMKFATENQLPNGLVPFFHRGTKSDFGVLGQIFVSKDYDLSRLQRWAEIDHIYEYVVNSGKKPLIIDAGANIGASVIWFTKYFPNAHICAFEPEHENFTILETNVKEYQSAGDIQIVQAAVGAVDGFVDIVDAGQGECGFRTEITSDGNTLLVSLARFVSEKASEGYVPFIVKIDIEGGEEQLFSQDCEWINAFPLIIIELHDWLIPRKMTSKPFIKFISTQNRDFVYIGENIFSISNAIGGADEASDALPSARK